MLFVYVMDVIEVFKLRGRLERPGCRQCTSSARAIKYHLTKKHNFCPAIDNHLHCTLFSKLFRLQEKVHRNVFDDAYRHGSVNLEPIYSKAFPLRDQTLKVVIQHQALVTYRISTSLF